MIRLKENCGGKSMTNKDPVRNSLTSTVKASDAKPVRPASHHTRKSNGIAKKLTPSEQQLEGIRNTLPKVSA